MDTYNCVVLVVLHLAVVESLTPAVLSVRNVVEGTTASFECSFSVITSTSSLLIKKDGVTIYGCGSLTFACSAISADSDYSDVAFPGIGTTSGKGTFTVDNADQARDGGIWVCKYGSSLESDPVTFVVNAPTQAVLSVQNVVEGETATFDCSHSSITSTSSLEIRKDNEVIYTCANIAFTCSALSAEADYSGVTFTGIGTPSGNGTFTVDNANQARDGGSWLCKYGSSLESVPVVFVVNVSETECSQCWYYWLFLLMLIPFVGLVGAIIFISRYKTLVISTLYVKVCKTTVQLSWKPFRFEPVPDTLYAKCAQNGLTENVEFKDGLFFVSFRDLVPGTQYDVTVYCQNAADMKLYKSETCVVFTLRDSSITNPKEGNTVLALHSLDLTVYQTKVKLSWTAPIAFDSTKVEYWVGSGKHITISADTTSLATSTAEMTRLLPESVISFTITGEKDGTKYPSGIRHQKTLKVLTGCCP